MKSSKLKSIKLLKVGVNALPHPSPYPAKPNYPKDPTVPPPPSPLWPYTQNTKDTFLKQKPHNDKERILFVEMGLMVLNSRSSVHE